VEKAVSSLPQLENALFAFTIVVGAAAVRFLPLYIKWWKPSNYTSLTQRKRYAAAITALLWVGIPTSLMLHSYSLSQIGSAFSSPDGTLKIAAWVSLCCSVVVLVASIAFLDHTLRNPTRFAKYDFGRRQYLTMEEYNQYR
jgi:uncharacterized sodium:solute symporter family permease YidK